MLPFPPYSLSGFLLYGTPANLSIILRRIYTRLMAQRSAAAGREIPKRPVPAEGFSTGTGLCWVWRGRRASDFIMCRTIGAACEPEQDFPAGAEQHQGHREIAQAVEDIKGDS